MELNDDDDWDLSADQLDSLERDAFQKIAQQRLNPPTLPSSSSSSINQQQHAFSSNNETNYCYKNNLESSNAQPIADSRSSKVPH